MIHFIKDAIPQYREIPSGLTQADLWVFIILVNLAAISSYVAPQFATLYIMIAFLLRNRRRWIDAFKEVWK